jgi:hypothetical protein
MEAIWKIELVDDKGNDFFRQNKMVTYKELSTKSSLTFDFMIGT